MWKCFRKYTEKFSWELSQLYTKQHAQKCIWYWYCLDKCTRVYSCNNETEYTKKNTRECTCKYIYKIRVMVSGNILSIANIVTSDSILQSVLGGTPDLGQLSIIESVKQSILDAVLCII